MTTGTSEQTVSRWEPGGWRKRRQLAGLHDGIPDHAKPYLDEWCRQAFNSYDGLDKDCALTLEIEHDPRYRRATESILGACHGKENLQLDVIDYILAWISHVGRFQRGSSSVETSRALVEDLMLMLGRANMSLTVKADGSGLGYRAPEGFRESAETAVNLQEAAGAHLKTAFDQAWGYGGDGQGAFKEAQKAVEAALKPIVSPKNEKTTLGTIIRDVSQAGEDKFVLNLVDKTGHPADTKALLLNAVKFLWNTERNRHGTDAPPEHPMTVEEARTAVTLATMVVTLAGTGALRNAQLDADSATP